MSYKVDGKIIVNPDGTFLGSGRSKAEAQLIANKLNWYEQRLVGEKTVTETPLIDYLKKLIPPQATVKVK